MSLDRQAAHVAEDTDQRHAVAGTSTDAYIINIDLSWKIVDHRTASWWHINSGTSHAARQFTISVDLTGDTRGQASNRNC